LVTAGAALFAAANLALIAGRGPAASERRALLRIRQNKGSPPGRRIARRMDSSRQLDPLRHHRQHEGLHGAFGADRFGRNAERVARFFGTPRYIVGQTIVVIAWIALNAAAAGLRWDPYPFILLNLAFSTQAAYAAPLILLAQTRQADRDKAEEVAGAAHAEEIAHAHQELLQQNTDLTLEVKRLTEQVERLARAIHQHVVTDAP
jgi:uncharacterized membrane protein